MKYCLEQDQSSHWYIISTTMKMDWALWVNLPDDDPKSWEVPSYAKAIDGPESISFNVWEDNK